MSSKNTTASKTTSEIKEQAAVAGDMMERINRMEEEIKSLALTIDEVEDEKLEVTNQLKQALADYQNLESGIDKRVHTKVQQSKISVARELTQLKDDMFFAVRAGEDIDLPEGAKNWLQGVLSSMEKMETVLSRLGVSTITVSSGDEFDSSLHEAVSVIPGDSDNTVIDVLQPGYMMDELIIKPARVVVSKSNK